MQRYKPMTTLFGLALLLLVAGCTPPHVKQKQQYRQQQTQAQQRQADPYPVYPPAAADNDATYSIPYRGEQERGEYMLLLIPEYE
jgi:outer membrane biogenesis lipoprotein LolB